MPPIIDPHVHLWDQRGTPRETSPLVKLIGWHRPSMQWLAKRVFPTEASDFFGKPDYLLDDYLPPDYLADTTDSSVAGFVHVEAGWKGKGALAPVDETRWLESLDAPVLKGIVGYADLTLGEDVERVLAGHVAASDRFRGIRYTLSHHPAKGVLSGCDHATQARDPAWREGYATLAKYELSFDATVYHHQIDDITALARDFPEVPIILCHAGTPPAYGGVYAELGGDAGAREKIARDWREAIKRLAEQPNVVMKISGLVMPILGWGYHHGSPPTSDKLVEDLAPLVTFLIDRFGAERCMFASNFPIDKVSASWSVLYDAFERVVSQRSEQEQRALFHGTAVAAYRLDL